MNLKYTLPEQYEVRLRGKVDAAAPDYYCVPYDMTLLQSYVAGLMVVTRTHYYLCQDGEVVETGDVQPGDEYTAVVLTGSGVLERKRGGVVTQIAAYTGDHFARYGFIARILNEFAEGDTPRVVSDDNENRCAKCGRNFLRGTKICPFCLDRGSIFVRLIKVAAHHKWFYAAAFVMFFISSALMLYVPQINREMIDQVFYADPPKTTLRLLLFYVGLTAGLNIVNVLVNIVRELIMNYTATALTRDLRGMLFDKIQSLSLGYIETKRVGQLMHNINGDTRRIQNFIQFIASHGLNDIILMGCVVVVMLLLNWKLALLVVLPTPFAVFLMAKLFHKFNQMFHNQWHKLDVLDSLLNDVLNGIKVVKCFGQEEREIGRFANDAGKVRDITAKNEKFFFLMFPFFRFALGFGAYFVLLYGGNLVLNLGMTVGELFQFNTYASYLYQRMDWISLLPRRINECLTSSQRIFEIMDQEPEVEEIGELSADHLAGAVKFNNVTFGYHSHIPVLKHINIDVAPGEMIGLVGHSGSGKSTFINLVMRLYEVDEGAVVVDGHDVRDYPQAGLKANIGVVLQEPFLFSGTILENIRYSKPSATVDEVIRATKVAGAHDFIVKFPDGYDTRVGEKGQRLSGGERQRISIARAVLCDPKILILDEATASVDTQTEKQIQDALGRLVKGRTTFAIAHRLSTLRNANRILVLEKGKLLELDTHDNLMKKQGKYFDLVNAQLDMHRLDA